MLFEFYIDNKRPRCNEGRNRCMYNRERVCTVIMNKKIVGIQKIQQGSMIKTQSDKRRESCENTGGLN